MRAFLHVDVDYYKYYGPLLMGTKVKVHGYFGKGGYDPFNNPNITNDVEYTYYDSKGKIKNKNRPSNVYNDKYLLPEEEEILYEKKFNNTILRFTRVDYVLGQNMLVHVIRSRDNGKNFYNISDELIQVSNEASFIFLNENLGFAINTGKIFLDKRKTGLYITQDSGKSFKPANFNYKNENIEYIKIKDIPYYENNILKIKCLIPNIKNKNQELIFISSDNGLNWDPAY